MGLKKKRVLAVLLALCMVAGLAAWPVNTKVARAAVFGDYEYVTTNGQVQITGYTGSASSLAIPGTIGGRTVTSIKNGTFRGCTSLTQVSIPNSVTNIGEGAFYGCTNLQHADIPAGLTQIEGYLFAGCTSLMEVGIPAGVTSIGSSAFSECGRLVWVGIPVGVTSIGTNAFSNCGNLSGIELPTTMESIGAGAFAGCARLAGEIYIPAGIGSINGSVFAGCVGITKVSIPDGVADIRDSAFEGCTGLAQVSIPASVTSIGQNAFQQCFSLTTVNYSGTRQQWDALVDTAGSGNGLLADITVHCSGDSSGDNTQGDYEYQDLGNSTIEITRYTGSGTTVDIPGQIEGKPLASIGESAFKECRGIRTVRLPDSVVHIKEAAFRDCTSLTQINLPDGLTDIGEAAFGNCTRLAGINFPSSSLTSIGQTAFYGCASLQEMNIPSGITSIEPYVFAECTGLTRISLPSGVNRIGQDSFAGCINLAQISIPDGVTEIEGLAFVNCTGLREVSLPSNLASIGEYAFSDCISLTGISFPSSLATIGWAAFSGCTGLQAIELPSGITSIDGQTFYNCMGLTRVSLPDSVASIGESAFSGCAALTELSLPSRVTSIGREAFRGCILLEKIDIPAGVTRIGLGAFQQCGSLTDVYYSGTKEQWNGIEINTTENDSLLNATIHCSDGTIQSQAQLYDYEALDNGTIKITKYNGTEEEVAVPEELGGKRVAQVGSGTFENANIKKITLPSGVSVIKGDAFKNCGSLTDILVGTGNQNFVSENGVLFTKTKAELVRCPQAKSGAYAVPSGVAKIGDCAFESCSGLTDITIPEGATQIGPSAFASCGNLKNITIPASVTQIAGTAFSSGTAGGTRIGHVYYGGTNEQWEQITVTGDGAADAGSVSGKLRLADAVLHFQEAPSPEGPTDPNPPETTTARQELERLKQGDPLALDAALGPYLSAGQIGLVESCLFTWLAEIDNTCQFSGSTGVKGRVRKKAGIDPQGNFASGTEHAITHISVTTAYGPKTFEFTLALGRPDNDGNLYPAYGAMHYEVLEKEGIPSDVPKSGQVGKDSYADMGTFIQCMGKASEGFLHSTFQWQSLSDELTAGVLVDKTVVEVIGNQDVAFSDGTYMVYAQPLLAYSKKVTISCPVDVYVYGMDGSEAGSIVDNQPHQATQNVRLDVDGDAKTVYLTGDDYYMNLRGTDTGTMKYEVEEVANDEVKRNVQFLELQLEKDMQYEGYVFRPLNIDRNLYALRTLGGSGEIVYPDSDSYEPLFKKVQGMSLSQQNTSLNTDKTVQLNASLFPLDASNPNLQWISDDPSVASVGSDGLVTAVGAGRATITVMTRDGSFLKESCIIDVQGGTAVPSPGPDTPVQPGTPTQPDKPAQPGTSTQPGASTQPGTSTQPGASAGTTPPATQPPQDEGPVVAKLYYVLQFHANGGSNLSRRTMTLLTNDSPGILPKVQRKAYTFGGWYTAQDGGTQVSGDKPLDAATTLYARWTKTAAPQKPKSLTLVSKKKGQMQVQFQKASGAAGYQVAYATNKKFASANTKKKLVAANKKTITGLKSGKTYYVKVRAYGLDSMGNKVYGAYSAVKKGKVKA